MVISTTLVGDSSDHDLLVSECHCDEGGLYAVHQHSSSFGGRHELQGSPPARVHTA